MQSSAVPVAGHGLGVIRNLCAKVLGDTVKQEAGLRDDDVSIAKYESGDGFGEFLPSTSRHQG